MFLDAERSRPDALARTERTHSLSTLDRSARPPWPRPPDPELAEPHHPTSEVGKVLDLIRQKNIQVVDVKFCDLPGTWQHFSIPAATLDEEMIQEGLGFDGSSIRGFQAINESDMLLLPDVSTAFVDPVLEVPTLSLTCDIYDPLTLEPYSRDPALHRVQGRGVPQDHGHRHHVVLGAGGGVLHLQLRAVRPERARGRTTTSTPRRASGTPAATAAAPNLGHRPRHKEGYFPVPPVDRLQDVRSKIMLALIEAGVPVEVQHHEVGTAGQAEIDIRFGTLVQTADRLMVYKYIVKNVCHNLGYTATFMPKPLFGDNGSGMHCHQSLWKGDTPALLRRERLRADLRDGAALHRRAHRPRAGAAGALRADDQQLPPAGARLRGAGQPDVLGAEPVGHLPDSDVLREPQGQAGRVPRARSDRQPVSRLLRDAHGGARRHQAQARAARADRRGPLRDPRRAQEAHQAGPGQLRSRWRRSRRTTTSCSTGDVFTPDVLDTWITMKRTKDIAPVNLRPHPYEFFLYYDA